MLKYIHVFIGGIYLDPPVQNPGQFSVCCNIKRTTANCQQKMVIVIQELTEIILPHLSPFFFCLLKGLVPSFCPPIPIKTNKFKPLKHINHLPCVDDALVS